MFTTNHKRISINYFNFVLVAGTAGMSLATVIRLEFAYPGVGILAGDSLQYLSVATSHGVIMVFYMIMPAIFGAFGNFLLPTQLGVHDVAFPRLNSAAFWFLPGGLIMLCQLVCTDRRYARMNCFNIRELQGILKRKFFTDLINSHDHRFLLDKSMIGVRYKSNTTSNTSLDINNFYNLGLFDNNLSKFFVLNNQNGLNLNSKLFTDSTNNSSATLYPSISNLNYFFLIFVNNKFYLTDLVKVFNANVKLNLTQIYEKICTIYNDLFEFIILRYAMNLDIIYFYVSSFNLLTMINIPKLYSVCNIFISNF